MTNLGIDLGTSNSVAAIALNDGSSASTVEPSAGVPLDGYLVYPSYIAFEEDGTVAVVGLSAKERYGHGSNEYVFRHIKRLIGKPYDYVQTLIELGNPSYSEFEGRITADDDGSICVVVGDKRINVLDVTTFLLKVIYEDACKQAVDKIDSVTISLPAGFDDLQRQATIGAAKKGGYEKGGYLGY